MRAQLDALCRRFAIDLSARTTHNALLDCRLLAEVYVELTGGRQRALLPGGDEDNQAQMPSVHYDAVGPRTPRHVVPTADERTAHAGFVGKLKEAIWKME